MATKGKDANFTANNNKFPSKPPVICPAQDENACNNAKRKDSTRESTAGLRLKPDTAPTALPVRSPFEIRHEEYAKYKALAGIDYQLFFVSTPFEFLTPTRRQELGLAGNWREHEHPGVQAGYNLTQEEIERYDFVMIIPRTVTALQDCFYREISQQGQESLGWILLLAKEEIKRAARQDPVTTRRAQKAFLNVLAIVVACDRIVFDARDDSCLGYIRETIAPALVRLVQSVLWFEDMELGFCDPYTRKGFLRVLEKAKWLGGNDAPFATAKNGHGFGRLAVPPEPQGLDDYLASALPNMSQKDNSVLQLILCRAEDPRVYTTFVVSGNTTMNKLGQLCAFLTFYALEFSYRSDCGSCLEGSRFELSVDALNTWLGDDSLLDQALANGATLQKDIDVKITQVFQGSANESGLGAIVFDSKLAAKIARKPGAITWVAPTGSRYCVLLHSILTAVPNSRLEPLPRVVVASPYSKNPNVQTPFGHFVHSCNTYLRAERPSPEYEGSTFEQYQKSLEAMARPL